MSLPYIKCPKCQELSSSQDYWVCPNCGYSESRESVLLEENKDYEEQRNKNWENREAESKKWEEEQEKLCQKVVDYLLPNRNLEINFADRLPYDNLGMSLYRENNQVKAELAKQRLTESGNLNKLRIDKLITYSQEPSIIMISRQALRVKEISSKIGLAGFLPTSSHEAAHISWEVNHNPLYKPWIDKGHDEVWRTVYEKFYEKAKRKFGQTVDKRFKQLEEIKKAR